MSAHRAHRHLMRPPVALLPLAVDLLGACPALRRAHDDHRPDRAFRKSFLPGVSLDAPDLADHGFERGRHEFVHHRRVIPFDEMRRVAVSAKEQFKLLVTDARQHCRIGDLIAVEMQDRQHRAVAHRIEELVGMPARRKRSCLRFAITDDGGHNEVGIVEGRAEGMRKCVTKLATFVYGAWRLRRHMARNPARKRELGEKPLHALHILRDSWIDFAVCAFEIGVGDQPRSPMPGAGDVDHIKIEFLDQPIEMRVNEVEARRRAPMPEKARLDVLLLERLTQQGVVEQVDLTDRQIVGGAPVSVDERAFGFRQRASGFRCVLFRQSGRGRHRQLLTISLPLGSKAYRGPISIA